MYLKINIVLTMNTIKKLNTALLLQTKPVSRRNIFLTYFKYESFPTTF